MASDTAEDIIAQDVSSYRHWCEVYPPERVMEPFATAEQALVALREVRPDCKYVVPKVFEGVPPNTAIQQQVLYALISSRSILDLRLLHTVRLVDAARDVRRLYLQRDALAMALHRRAGADSRLMWLDSQLFGMILEMAGML